MGTIVIWVFVTCGGYGGGNCSFSPPHASKESCEWMQKVIGKGQCISMTANKGAN
jgi:hypothetical protein